MGLGRRDWDGLAVCVLALSVYLNTLDHAFVYDDHRAILTNPDVQPSTPISQVFRNDFWGTPMASSGSHGSYRPLVVLSYRLNVWASGLRPLGFHLTNVLLHVVATGLVLLTARTLLPGRSPTLAAALFAVHPVHVEAVAGLVGRADVLAAIFYLMSFLFYVNHVKLRENTTKCLKKVSKKVSHSKTQESLKDSLSLKSLGVLYPKGEMYFYTLFLVFAVLAVLCKEPAVTVIPLAVCYNVILQLRSTRLPNLRKSSIAPSASASTFAFLIIILLRFSIMGLQNPSFSKADNPIAKENSLLTRTLSFLYLPVFNFFLLLFPNSLSFDWSMDAIPRIHSIIDHRCVSIVLFYSVAIKILQILFKRSVLHVRIPPKPKSCKTCSSLSPENHVTSCRLLNNNNIPQKCVCLINSRPQKLTRESAGIMCLAFIVLPFIPASNLFFYVGFVAAERVLYIPSVGFCLLIALGSHTLWSQGKKSLVLSCCLLLLTAFAVRTIQRNKDWRDEESLYRSAIGINPPKAFGNLGSVLSSQGRLKEAEESLRQALQHRPTMADVHFNLGNLLNRQGKLEDAVKSYENAIRYRPSLAVAYLNLGQTLETMNRKDEAERAYYTCVKLDATGLKDPRAHEEATRACLRLLTRQCGEEECRPDTLQLISSQEFTRKRGNKYTEASKPDVSLSTETHNNHIRHLQRILKNKTFVSGEEELYLRALYTSPDNPANYIGYGQLLVKHGRKGEAATLYLRAAQLQPQHHSMVVSAAVALRHAGRLAEAEVMYRRARDLRPRDATSHSNLGAILHLQGKHQQAAASYKEALKLSPGDRVTLANLQKLNNLLSRTKR